MVCNSEISPDQKGWRNVPIAGHSANPAAFESVIANTDKHYELPVSKVQRLCVSATFAVQPTINFLGRGVIVFVSGRILRAGGALP